MPKKMKLNGTVIADDERWIYDWFGISNISPGAVSDFLDEANGEDVEFLINSGGGLVDSGSEIYSMLKSYAQEHNSEVVTKVTGTAGSASSVIAMGGTKTLMSPTSQIMIHNASTVAWGDKNQMGSVTEMLSNTDEAIANAYTLKTGKDRSEILDMMNKTTWLNAQQAVEMGFADEIMFTEKVAVTNSVMGGQILPPEVIEKMRNQMGELQQRKNAAPPTPPATPPIENKEEPKKMDMNQLKQDHPELFEQVKNDVLTAERNRIASLQTMASAPGAAQFVNEAILNGETAGDLAIKIVNASAQRQTQEAQNRQDDAEESGVNAVAHLEAQPKGQADAERKANLTAYMIEKAKNTTAKLGGRK